MDPSTETNNATEAPAGPKERAIFYLKALIELIEADKMASGEIEGKTADEVINMAEGLAARAVDETQKLKDGI